jgi:signal peptidase II
MQKAKCGSWIGLVFMIFGSIGMDQMTKYLAEKELMVWSHDSMLTEYHGKRLVLQTFGTDPAVSHEPHFFVATGLAYVRNQGAAWGAFSELREDIRVPFFYLVTVLAVLLIGYYLRTTPVHHRIARFGLTLVLSGAMGNFCDRIRLGYVIDFLDVSWVIPLPWRIDLDIHAFPSFLSALNLSIHTDVWAYDFPKFNWADSMITIGVFFLLIDMLILETLRKQKEGMISVNRKRETHESTTVAKFH